MARHLGTTAILATFCAAPFLSNLSQADDALTFRIEDVAKVTISDYRSEQASLSVDPHGTPHIGFIERRPSDLSYATKQETGWATAPTGARASHGINMLLDAAGLPLITYSTDGDVGAAIRSNDTWSASTLFDVYGLHRQATTLDQDGNMHIVYLWSTSGGMYVGHIGYAHRVGTDWQHRLIETSPYTFAGTDRTCRIALDTTGSPHICVGNRGDFAVRYWNEEIMNTGLEVIGFGRGANFELDETDTPHVTFADRDSQHLMYASRIEGKWLVEEIDKTRLVTFSSLTLDNLGAPHVAYYDSQYEDLWYATRAAPSEPWTHCIVDQEGDVGNSASIDVDASGAVHITYFDNTRATLKYATTLAPVTVQETNWATVKSSFR